MSVPISGILLDPYGNVARFADIKFVTVQGTLDVIESSSAVFRTDENGAYSIDVQFGRFAVLMRFNGNNGAYDKIQTISVNSDTVASTLGELLAYTEPLTPAEILLVQQLVAQAIAAKDDAEAAALQAAIEAANAAASAAAALASEIAAANSVALLAPVPLNGGVWASGQTFTAYNQYMIYNGEAYSPRQETTLPYTVGATPDLGFVYQIKLNSLQALSGLTERSDLAQRVPYSTTVATVEAGNYKAGDKLTLLDRGDAPFNVVAGGTPNGYDILDAGNGNTAVLQVDSILDPAHIGAKTTGDATAALQAALDTGLHIDGNGRSYSAVGLTDAANLRCIRNITLIKGANGTVLTSTGRAPQFSDVLIDGLNGFSGDNWVITGDNPDLLNCGSRTDGGGLALRAEGNGTNIQGSKEAYQSVGQAFSIQIGNVVTQTLYAKISGIDTQTGGGIRWIKHGTASIVGGQIGGSTVEFGSYSIWHSDCRVNGSLVFNGSGGVESSSVSGNLTIGNGVDAISQVTISDDVVVQSGYTVTLNANVRESSINLAQMAQVGGVTIVDNLTGTANDVGNSIYLPPIAYTPSWTATTTNPSIGDGTLSGYYTRSGKTISINISLTWGSTTNGGSGDWFFNVPKASGAYGTSVGSVLALDSGAGYANGNSVLPPSSSLISQYIGPEPIAGRTRFNRPFVWAAGDDFKMSMSYQIG